MNCDHTIAYLRVANEEKLILSEVTESRQLEISSRVVVLPLLVCLLVIRHNQLVLNQQRSYAQVDLDFQS